MANTSNEHMATAEKLLKGSWMGPALDQAQKWQEQAYALRRCGRPGDLVEAANMSAAADLIFSVVNGDDE